MFQKNLADKSANTLEATLVLNFIRLCESEGVDSTNTHKALEMRLHALNELKIPRT